MCRWVLLVVAICVGLLAALPFLASEISRRNNGSCTVNSALPDDTRSLLTADGRRVAWSEYGDAQSASVVVFLHGMPGSRYDGFHLDAAARRARVRLVSVDRPGYGLSTCSATAAQTLASDVLAVMDELRVARFALCGVSGGGLFAIAGAALLPPTRLSRVLAVSTLAPHDAIEDPFRGLPAASALLFRLPPQVGAFLSSLLLPLVASEQRGYPPELLAALPAADRRLLEDSAVAAGCIRSALEGLRCGTAGVIADHAFFADSKHWPFTFADVAVPITVVHGSADANVPLRHAEFLASVLPDRQLRVLDDEAHLSSLRSDAVAAWLAMP